jgi:rubrerythrin
VLKIDATRVQAVLNAQRAEDLYEHLQGAIQLEHATIPVYLTALFSIKRGAMADIAEILSSIVVEEMLHLTIACNVLNAIGGRPRLNDPAFIPRYPGPLPMNINTSLTVHLGPLSLDRIRTEFMEIEEPETPLVFPIRAALAAEAAPTFATIGQFYSALIERITELGDEIFTGPPAWQVVNEQWFPADELFAVHDVDSAVRALRLIVEQGEGTHTSPLDAEGDLAHYYRFQEIVKGFRLVKDPSIPEGFSFSGAPITFDANGVWNMVTDPRGSAYRPGSRARILSDQFNYTYTSLLNALHETFNGQPTSLDRAMGLMFELKVAATQLISVIDETTGKQAAPSFEYAAPAAAPPTT